MGQLIDRLGKFIKSEIKSNDFNPNSFIESSDDELKRIIEDLNRQKAKDESSKNQTGSNNYNNNHSSGGAASNTMNLQRAYSILGLESGADEDTVKAAYIKKVKEYHPDKVATLGDELKELASKKTQEINEAYNFLKNYNR